MTWGCASRTARPIRPRFRATSRMRGGRFRGRFPSMKSLAPSMAVRPARNPAHPKSGETTTSPRASEPPSRTRFSARLSTALGGVSSAPKRPCSSSACFTRTTWKSLPARTWSSTGRCPPTAAPTSALKQVSKSPSRTKSAYSMSSTARPILSTAQHAESPVSQGPRCCTIRSSTQIRTTPIPPISRRPAARRLKS